MQDETASGYGRPFQCAPYTKNLGPAQIQGCQMLSRKSRISKTG